MYTVPVGTVHKKESRAYGILKVILSGIPRFTTGLYTSGETTNVANRAQNVQTCKPFAQKSKMASVFIPNTVYLHTQNTNTLSLSLSLSNENISVGCPW